MAERFTSERFDEYRSRIGEGMSSQDSGIPENLQASQQLIDQIELTELISKNLDSAESELKLYRDGSKTGLRFQALGTIDIIAVDKESRPVVFKVELGLASRFTLAELLLHMSFVDEKLGLGRSRGVIVAKEFEMYLDSAVSRVPGVALMKYELGISMKRVTDRQ